jgi:predicted transglutaminase-like cysteine proteinase
LTTSLSRLVVNWGVFRRLTRSPRTAPLPIPSSRHRALHLLPAAIRTATLSIIAAVHIIVLPALLGLGGSHAQTLVSLPTERQRLAVGTGAQPTAAWDEFCRRFPSECEVDVNEPEFIRITSATWTLIKAVNDLVNSSVKPRTDWAHWGVEDRWDFPDDGYGDCEDFQLLKRRLLADAGLPRRAMRMTVVLDEAREGHAVLTLRTDRGEYILDNKTNALALWSDTGYEFVKREGSDGLTWVALSGQASPVGTAKR